MSEEQEKWNCAKCKAENKPEDLHCAACGEPNPKTHKGKCKVCGLISEYFNSCPACGSSDFLSL